jgi:hypothetical protein
MDATIAATQPVLDWIAAHPYQTIFHVVNGVVLLTPAAATVPIFTALGFSAKGPIGGTPATYLPIDTQYLR